MPNVLYNLDFANDHYMRAYHDMQEAVGLANSIESNGISPWHYKNGWCFFAFSLTNDLLNSPTFDLIKQGTTSILIRFASPVRARGIHLLAYGELDSLMMLDKVRVRNNKIAQFTNCNVAFRTVPSQATLLPDFETPFTL